MTATRALLLRLSRRMAVAVLVLSTCGIQWLAVSGYLSSEGAAVKVQSSSVELGTVGNIHRDVLILTREYERVERGIDWRVVDVRRGTLQWQLNLAQQLAFEDQHVMTVTADIRRQLDELGALADQGRTARATPEMVESVYTRTAEVEIDAKTLLDEEEHEYFQSVADVVQAQRDTQKRLLLIAPISAFIGLGLFVSLQRQTRARLQAAAERLKSEAEERREAEAARQLSERRLQAILANVTEAVFEADGEGRWTFLSPAWKDITGGEVEDGLGMQLSDIADAPPGPAAMAHAAATSHSQEFALRLPDRAGQWMSISAKPLAGEPAEAPGWVGMLKDVTQERGRRIEVDHAQRLQSVGSLAAGIAHEMNTPMQYVGDNLRFLEQAFDTLTGTSAAEDPAAAAEVEYLREEVPNAIKEAVEGVRRVSEIVRAMKMIGHPGQSTTTATDVNEAIRAATVVARNEYKFVADLVLDLDESLPFLACNAGDVNQVVLNLVINAAHAIAAKPNGPTDRGTITVSTMQVNDGIQVAVSDTGTGMPEDVRRRIFDPFFTTKEVGKGTGQGLAIARTLVVDRYEGRIDVASTPGEGTTFTMFLPLKRARDLEAALV
jgi:PAS domain S-box-containing protein